MAISSIHIESGKIGFFSHNSRERETENTIFEDEENFCTCDNKSAINLYKSELQKRTNAYLRNHPTRKKLHSKTITHLSSIANFNYEHTPEDIKKVCDYLEETFDTKVLQFSMHRDEGHILENGTPDKNYHAHIEFMGLDSQGNSIRRKLGKKQLSELQTKTAELLNMERGQNFNKEFKEFKQGIRKEMPTKAKRLGTYEYKKAKENESKLTKATKKELDQTIDYAEEILIKHNSIRDNYAELEQLNKDLKEEFKIKNLTVEDMENQISTLQHNLIETKNTALKRIVNIKEQNIELLEKINYEKDEYELLERDNRTLEIKVVELEEKINSRPSISDYEDNNTELEKEKVRSKRLLAILGQINTKLDLKVKQAEDFKDTLYDFVQRLVNKINELKKIILNKDIEIGDLQDENERKDRIIRNYEIMNETTKELQKIIEPNEKKVFDRIKPRNEGRSR